MDSSFNFFFWTCLRSEPLLCCSFSFSLSLSPSLFLPLSFSFSLFLSSVWNVHVLLPTTLLLSYIVKALYCYMVLICSFSYLEYFPTAVSLLASGVSLMNDQRIGTQSVVGVLWEHRENILTCHNTPKPNDRPPLLSRHSTCQVIVVWRTSYEYGLGSRKEGPCILRLTSFLTHFYLLHQHMGMAVCDPGEREHVVHSGPEVPRGYRRCFFYCQYILIPSLQHYWLKTIHSRPSGLACSYSADNVNWTADKWWLCSDIRDSSRGACDCPQHAKALCFSQ